LPIQFGSSLLTQEQDYELNIAQGARTYGMNIYQTDPVIGGQENIQYYEEPYGEVYYPS